MPSFHSQDASLMPSVKFGCQVDAKWLNQVKVAFEQKIHGGYCKNATRKISPVSLKTVLIDLIKLNKFFNSVYGDFLVANCIFCNH